MCVTCLIYKTRLRAYARQRRSLERSAFKFSALTAQSNIKVVELMMRVDKYRKECVVEYTTHVNTDHR